MSQLIQSYYDLFQNLLSGRNGTILVSYGWDIPGVYGIRLGAGLSLQNDTTGVSATHIGFFAEPDLAPGVLAQDIARKLNTVADNFDIVIVGEKTLETWGLLNQGVAYGQYAQIEAFPDMTVPDVLGAPSVEFIAGYGALGGLTTVDAGCLAPFLCTTSM